MTSQSTPEGFFSSQSARAEPEYQEGEQPNIYRGNKESTWRHRNADAIDTLEYVEENRSQDLSIHLFNCTKLRHHGLTRDAQLADPGAESKDIWRPPKHWTVWPLPPDRVPRELGYEPGATLLNLPPPYINRAVKPSLLLQEVLLAYTLKRANATFKESKMSDQMSTSPSSEDLDDVPETPIPNAVDSALDSSSRSPSPTASQYSFIADDDEASAVLNPSIRHILSQLNTLLSALHKSRLSYAPPPEGRSYSRSRSRRRAGTPAPRSRGRSVDTKDDDVENTSRGRATSRPRSSFRERSRRRQQRLGLQEWGDVLGFALASGWDAETVERTGRRCEELFGNQGEKGWRLLLPVEEAKVDLKSFLVPVEAGRRNLEGKGKEREED